MTIPNMITVSRLFLIPVFMLLMFQEKYVYAIMIFLFAGTTDILDGYIARRYNLVTKFGQILDPLADKLMQVTALVVILVMDIIPGILPIVAIVIVKEVAMVIGSMVLWKSGITIAANWYGKAATVIFYAAIVLSIIFRNYGIFFLVAAVISTVFAFLMYMQNYFKIRKTYQV